MMELLECNEKQLQKLHEKLINSTLYSQYTILIYKLQYIIAMQETEL